MTRAIFDAVGMQYYLDNYEDLCDKNDEYDLTNAQLLKQYDDGDEIYQYEYSNAHIKIEPEPTNEHDPNAIRISYKGKTLGHIKREETDKVRTYLAEGLPYKVVIEGGPYKEISEDEDGKPYVEERETPLQVTVFFEDIKQQQEQAPARSKAPKKLLLILGIVLIVMSVLLLLASPVPGVIGIIIGIIAIIMSRK